LDPFAGKHPNHGWRLLAAINLTVAMSSLRPIGR
jgi:hypothetical protein